MFIVQEVPWTKVVEPTYHVYPAYGGSVFPSSRPHTVPATRQDSFIKHKITE